MGKILNYDGPVWNTLGKLTDIIILSLLFIVTSLPVITGGAALVALYDNMIHLSEDKENAVIKGFYKSFAANFKKVTPVWLLSLLIGIFLAGDIYICISAGSQIISLLIGPIAVLAVVYLMFATYFFPLISRLDADIRKIAYLSFMFSIKEFPRTLFLMFITAIMICVGIFVTAPFLVVAPGVIAFSHAFIFRDIFKKYGITEKGENDALS